MKIPKIRGVSFLNFEETKYKEIVVARSEGVNFWHLVNLAPGCSLGLLSIVLLYCSFGYLIYGEENKFGVFAMGLFISLLVAAFGYISSHKTIQAVWGAVTLTIGADKTLRIVHTVPIPLLAGDFPSEINPMRILLSHVKEVRIERWGTCLELLVNVKRSKWLPGKKISILSCRCQDDLNWLRSWIESHRINNSAS